MRRDRSRAASERRHVQVLNRIFPLLAHQYRKRCQQREGFSGGVLSHFVS